MNLSEQLVQVPRDDTPVIIGVLMDRFNLDTLEVTMEQLLHFEGRFFYDFDYKTGTYTIKLERKDTASE